jgi:anti-anti-sigma factor
MTAAAEASAAKGSVRIRLSGEIDRANVAALEDQIRAVVSGHLTAVSVDLTRVTSLNSTGKRLLFDLASALRESHLVLNLIVAVDSSIRRLIELSGLPSLAAVMLVRRDDSSDVSPLELVAPAQPWSLKNIRDALRGWLSTVGASPHVVDEILIAVGEACTNVIDHAYGAQGSGLVTLHLELKAPDVVATIVDTGQWGSPAGGNRGQGTLFMHTFSDEVRIDRRSYRHHGGHPSPSD